jgi:hypothetical protein
MVHLEELKDDGGKAWKDRIVLETDLRIATSQVEYFEVTNPSRKHGVPVWKGHQMIAQPQMPLLFLPGKTNYGIIVTNYCEASAPYPFTGRELNNLMDELVRKVCTRQTDIYLYGGQRVWCAQKRSKRWDGSIEDSSLDRAHSFGEKGVPNTVYIVLVLMSILLILRCSALPSSNIHQRRR